MPNGESSETGAAGRAGRRWGWSKLYAILGVGVLLCLAGYRLGTTPVLATLLQVAVVLAILGLLTGWARASLPALLPADGGAGASVPRPFSTIRIRLRPQQARAGQATAPLSERRRARALRLGARRLP
jgi:hypothetical protein